MWNFALMFHSKDIGVVTLHSDKDLVHVAPPRLVAISIRNVSIVNSSTSQGRFKVASLDLMAVTCERQSWILLGSQVAWVGGRFKSFPGWWYWCIGNQISLSHISSGMCFFSCAVLLVVFTLVSRISSGLSKPVCLSNIDLSSSRFNEQ